MLCPAEVGNDRAKTDTQPKLKMPLSKGFVTVTIHSAFRKYVVTLSGVDMTFSLHTQVHRHTDICTHPYCHPDS